MPLVADEAGISPDNYRWCISRGVVDRDPWLSRTFWIIWPHWPSAERSRWSFCPIGFLSDHMEVLYDLDEEGRLKCESLGIEMVRAGTVGTHPDFVRMVRDLILERVSGGRRPAFRAWRRVGTRPTTTCARRLLSRPKRPGPPAGVATRPGA